VSTLTWFLDKLFARRRHQRNDVRVQVHRATLVAPEQGDAYFITVLNTSPERSVTITNVWLETAVKISVLTRPLPVAIEQGQHWETWIEARELPPGTTDVEHLARVALADDTVIASRPREDLPAGGVVLG